MQWIENQRILETKKSLYFSDRSIAVLAKTVDYESITLFLKYSKALDFPPLNLGSNIKK